MENGDKRFEEFLGEFAPRKPRALPESIVHRQVWPRRLAAAAAVTIALGASLWSVRQKPTGQGAQKVTSNRPVATEKQTPRRARSLLGLTRLAVEHPSCLDAALEAAQGNQLPRFDRKNSALRILARE